jgi:hypothetical protein
MITGEAASERENWGKLPEDMLLCVELNLPFALTAVAFSCFHFEYNFDFNRVENESNGKSNNRTNYPT